MKRQYRNYSTPIEFYEKPIQVSLDVHTTNTFVHGINITTGEIVVSKNITGNYKNALKHIQSLGQSKKTNIVYEAGCFGFAPYRYFTKQGIPCQIIAPSSIPQMNTLRKCDRNDAINNLNFHLSGSLRYVHIPNPQDENATMCLRMRYAKVHEYSKCKQRIHSLIFRSGHEFTETKTYWTKAHWKWLENIELDPFARITLNSYMNRILTIDKEIEAIDVALNAYIKNNPDHAKKMQAYLMIPGFGFVNAITLLLEGQDLTRFRHPTALMSYVGVIPGKHMSGTSDPAMRITKNGNHFLRLALIGAAKQFRDPRLLLKKKALQALPEKVGAFITKMQDRLLHKYKSMVDRNKPSLKARVAVARELCGFMWDYATKIIPEMVPAI